MQSRDGFLFLPRYSFATAPALDRVVVAAGENDAAKQQVVAAWSASRPRQLAEDLYRNVGPGQSAYDVSFADLARTHNAFIARTMAHILFYTTVSSFPDAAWPIREAVAQLALMLLGAAIVYAATRLRLPRQRRLRPTLLGVATERIVARANQVCWREPIRPMSWCGRRAKPGSRLAPSPKMRSVTNPAPTMCRSASTGTSVPLPPDTATAATASVIASSPSHAVSVMPCHSPGLCTTGAAGRARLDARRTRGRRSRTDTAPRLEAPNPPLECAPHLPSRQRPARAPPIAEAPDRAAAVAGPPVWRATRVTAPTRSPLSAIASRTMRTARSRISGG